MGNKCFNDIVKILVLKGGDLLVINTNLLLLVIVIVLLLPVLAR